MSIVLTIKEEPSDDFIAPQDNWETYVNPSISAYQPQSNSSALAQVHLHAPGSYDSAAVKNENDRESDVEFEMKEDIHHNQCE